MARTGSEYGHLVVLRASVLALCAALLGGCGDDGSPGAGAVTAARDPGPAVARKAGVRDWPMFGVTAARANAYHGATGISGAGARRLRRTRVRLPGTVDSSPIFLHGVRVRGRKRDVIVVTTAYGQTLALAAYSGRVLWRFDPPGAAKLRGGPQFTNASPAADPDHRFVYAASPTGAVFKLGLASGRSVTARGWPARVTLLPTREKLPSALAVFGRSVLLTTDGYIGDAPPYQAHYVAIDRHTGARKVFNALCSERAELIEPSSCPQSGAAMFGRGSPVVDARAKTVWTATGNGAFDGRRYWGDSVLGLSLDGRLRRSFTPRNQAALNSGDVDVGSAAPALLPGGLMVQGGKEGKLVLLSRRAPSGATHAGPRLGGELQTLDAPGAAQMFTTIAVAGRRIFATTGSGTASYVLRGHRLSPSWSNDHAGTSPVVAGGLVWIYDPAGRLRAYRPATGRVAASLPAGAGHWNSPIVAARHVWLPEGDANGHAGAGVLDIYRLR
jgi:outer membrane protein assembly factor BamB